MSMTILAATRKRPAAPSATLIAAGGALLVSEAFAPRFATTKLLGRLSFALVLGAVAFALTACAPRPAAQNVADQAVDAQPQRAQPQRAQPLREHPLREHPEFELSISELENLVGAMPTIIQRAILERPQVFLELIGQALDLADDILILVDKNQALPRDFVPADLVSLNDYRGVLTLNRSDLALRRTMMPSLLALIEAARQAGIVLDISSTYRSYEYQEALFRRHVANLGEAQARRVSAEAGSSQHQLGTTLDFGSITAEFAQTAAGRWLDIHAWRFGFSLSYPEGFEAITGYAHEPWHYRYLSRLGTQIERQFFGGIQQYFLVFLHENRERLIAARIR